MTTIEFPRTLPSSKIKGVYFEPEPQQADAPEGGGREVSVVLGETIWHARYETTPASEAEFDEWRAWFSTLRGGTKQFYGRDVRRSMPRFYRQGFAGLTRYGGGAFDGSVAPSDWNFGGSGNSTRDEIRLTTLPAGLHLTIGDYFCMKWDSYKRSLHRIVTEAVANSIGVGNWSFEPPAPLGVSFLDSTLDLVNPSCLMTVRNVSGLDADGKDRRVAFDARQDFES